MVETLDYNNGVVYFEVQADDTARARAFYGEVFDWEWDDYRPFTQGREYWGLRTVPKDGTEGGLAPQRGIIPGERTRSFICTIGVEDIDAALERVVAAGGSVAQPKFALRGVAWHAYCLDTEGNIFGLHQPDHDAF